MKLWKEFLFKFFFKKTTVKRIIYKIYSMIGKINSLSFFQTGEVCNEKCFDHFFTDHQFLFSVS